MFLLLLKKQMTELFRGYFVDRKTGKMRPKSQVIMFILLFIGMLVLVSNAFSGIAKVLAASLIPEGYDWLYFALLGALTIAFGIFGSVFNTYSMLYLSKDNDMLLSMPIRPSVILNSRMASVYILSIIYEAVMYIPALIEYWKAAEKNALNIVFPSLNLFISGFAVLALTCLFGWLIALVSSHMRNKNILTVIFSLGFFALYYVAMFRLNIFLNVIMSRADEFAAKIQKYVYFLYIFGKGSTGDTKNFIIFALISFALFFIALSIMSKSFIRLATANKGMKKKAYKSEAVKSKKIGASLFGKELSRFLNTPIYLLNSGLGILIAPVGAIIALIKRADIHRVLGAMNMPEQVTLILPVMITAAICLVYSMDNLTAPSVSLEGKSLWILRSLPVDTKEILGAKIRLHFIFNSVPAVISAILFGAAFGFDIITIILISAAAVLFNLMTAASGLMLNLKKPDFMWTNETIPVKQDPPILFSMLIGMGSSAAGLGIGAVFGMIHTYLGLAAVCAVYGLVALLLLKKVNTKGVKLFENM